MHRQIVSDRRSHTQDEVRNAHPRKFPGYWWLFQMQHLSHYGATYAGTSFTSSLSTSRNHAVHTSKYKIQYKQIILLTRRID